MTRRWQEGRREPDGLALIERISAVTRSTLDLESLLPAAAGEIGAAFRAARCVVRLRRAGAPDLSAERAAPALAADRGACAALDAAIAQKLYGQFAAEALDVAGDEALARELAALAPLRSAVAAPLVLNGEITGALILYFDRRPRRLDRQKTVLRAVASALGLTIHQARAHETARNATEREELTRRLLTAIRAAAGVEGILKAAAENLGTALGVTRAVIYVDSHSLPGDEADGGVRAKLVARAEYRESVLIPSLLHATLDIAGTPLLGQLLAGEIIAIDDTSESHPVVRAIGVRLGVRAMLLAPIQYNGRIVAALALEQFERSRSFSEAEVSLVRLVIEQTAVALYHADLYRDAEEAARREALVGRISSAIHGTFDPEEVLQTIVNELGQALGVCRCRLALLPNPLPEAVPFTHEYVAACCADRQPALSSIPISGNPHFQAVIASDAPVASDDVENDLRLLANRERLKQSGVRSLLSGAIRAGGQPLGVLSLHHCEKRHHWTQWEMDVVRAVAEQAAVALRQSELYREARDSATRAALVNQIVAAIRRSLDLQETLQVAVEQLSRALGASRTNFRELVGDQIVVVAEHVNDPALPPSEACAAGDYVMTYLAETRRTLVIDDVQAFRAAYPDLSSTVRGWQVGTPALSQITCPIFVNEQFWGALSISQTDAVRKWTASEIALVEIVAAQVEVAVSHSHLFEEAQRAARREALISHIIHGINQSNRLDEIFPVVVSEIGEHLAADSVLVSRLDETAGLWTVECEYRDGEVRWPGRAYRAEDCAGLVAMLEGGPVVSADIERDDWMAAFRESVFRPSDTRAAIVVGLFYEGAPRLAILATMRGRPRQWTEEEVEVMRGAATHLMTAMERAELFEQISRGKHEWEETFDSLSDGIFIFDQHGILRRINTTGAAMENRPARELIGRRCCTLMQGIEGEQCRVGQVLQTGRPITFELLPERLGRPVLVTITPFSRRAGDGEPGEAGADAAGGAVCIVRDLSELRAAEADAREQRNFLAKLIEHANDAIFTMSPEGQFLWFNDQLVTLSGYSHDELRRGDFRRFILPDDMRGAVERFRRAVGGQAQTFEMQGLRKDGETRQLLITYTPIYDEGQVSSVLSIARDITEERLARERAAQADKLRALGQLASGVAHNFNNILAAILGHAQLIKRDCADERITQRIDIIERAALDGAQTVKRIQGFGLQQSAGPSSESVDINALVQDSTTLTRARWQDEAQARGLYYRVELDLARLPLARGAAPDLREVFVNIILNALDAMPQGGCLRIVTEQSGQTVRVHFIDNGIGMSREVREHIFEPFFTTKGVAGMGLGLAVSYSIVERYGGRIEASSNPGSGSTFTVTLPAVEEFASAAPGELADACEAASILVVDDDERVRDALVGMLGSMGHRTQQAASGREALLRLERERFDLAFTDLSMPEMDGWALAREIRRRWPDTRVVLITGYAVGDDALTERRELVDEVILKPIRLLDISSTIHQVLNCRNRLAV